LSHGLVELDAPDACHLCDQEPETLDHLQNCLVFSFVALLRPELFTFRKGVVRVETQGIYKGHTSMDTGLKSNQSVIDVHFFLSCLQSASLLIQSLLLKTLMSVYNVYVCRFNTENAWTGHSPILVAWTVDKAKVVAFVKHLLTV
jgi:uridine nucleosidase